MRGCLNCEVARARQPRQKIPNTRSELERAGFRWIHSRQCKLCGAWIEIHTTPAHTRVALEIRPEEEWKLFPHLYYCTVASLPKPAKQAEMFT